MALGPIMVDVAGTSLTEEETAFLQQPAVGAVIYFSRNFESVEQITALTEEIHALRDAPLLIAVDHEGGRVQRFRSGFTHLPAMRLLGGLFDRDAEQGLHAAHEMGWLMAAECRACGIDFSFAPILDLDYGVSSVIGDRAFHRDPSIVISLTNEFMQGMLEAGMQATGKHFPGHGAVVEDSHLTLPVDRRELADIRADDLIPFAQLIERGLAAIMPAHVVYDRIDSEPAGFSRFWLQDVLRKELTFDGVIFSDDLSMAGAAIAGTYTERAQKAFDAGCDMALVCNQPEAAREVVEAFNGYALPDSERRLASMRGSSSSLTWTELKQTQRWQDAVVLASKLTQNGFNHD